MSAQEPSPVFLHPGQCFFGDRHHAVRTLLGSCVAVTMWHPGRLLGGICHLVVPMRTGAAAIGKLDGRYGQEAVLWLFQEIIRHDTNPYDYEVNLYGGGRMFRRSTAGDSLDVGGRNVTYLKNLMQDLGFRLQGTDVGQVGSRLLSFDIGTGRISLRHRTDVLGRAALALSRRLP